MCSAEENNRSGESLHELMTRQFGLISRAQAAGHGLQPPAISRRVHSGEWAHVLPRVYRIAAAPVTRRQRALAAVLWAGDGALVSHAAAAVLWEFERVRARSVELWVPSNRKVRSESVVVHRGTRLDRADRTLLHGIPITNPARTLIDVSGRLEDHRLLTITEDLIRRDLVTPDRLRARLSALRASGRPGGGRLEVLLDERAGDRPLESALEALAWPIILGSGVPAPVRQFWVTVASGRYRLDFAWPEIKVGIECEGYEHHGSRHTWGKDRARFAELGAAGWRVLPLTWEACKLEPDRVRRWIAMAYANAA